LLAFPEPVKDHIGAALSVAQFGGKHPSVKPLEGPGAGCLVEHHDRVAYRAVYTVRFEDAIYVLHAFQKKLPNGIRTGRPDIEVVSERMKIAQLDCEERHAKAEE
jgi:phage-related protein